MGIDGGMEDGGALLTSCATGIELKRRRGFDAENFIDFIDDGPALGLGEGPFVIGALAGLGGGRRRTGEVDGWIDGWLD
jgi:hypothetical protein